MAECLEVLSDAFLEEQQEEVTVLQSIFEDDLQIVEGGDGHANICFKLTVKVNIPYDIINLEAFIPEKAPNINCSNGNGSNSELGNRPKDDKLEKETSSDNSFNNSHVSAQKNGLDASSLVKEEEKNSTLPEPSLSSFSGCTKPGFTRSVSMKHWHVKADIQYLTPIHLSCTFPRLYPTECPPEFSLACLWLTRSQLHELEGKLMKLWTETPNLPIVFTWADWLQNYAFEYLCLGSHLVLKDCENDTVPQLQAEAATNSLSFAQSEGFNTKLEMALLTIFNYDLEMQRQAFRQGTHLCEICFDERGGTEFHYLDECRHFFCTDCLKAHCQLHVDGGTVLKLLCPGHDCKTKIPPDILRMVLDAEKLERWERLLLSKTLDVMGGIVYCPRCNVAVLVDEDQALRLGHCANCFYAFCTECYEPWHHGQPCYEEGDSDSDDEDSSKSKEEVDSSKSKEEVGSIVTARTRFCQNCSVKKDKAKFHYMYKCRHFFCTECLRKYFQSNVDRGTVVNIQCLNRDCKAAISVEMAREVLDEKMFKQYIAATRMCSCQNCSAKKDKAEFHYMYECRHFFCTECLKAYFQWNIACGTVLNMRCPSHGCKAALSVELLREVLDGKVYKQYEKLFRAKMLEDMGISGVDFCPRCTVAVVEDEDESPTHRQCANCSFEFCTECFEPWHDGKPCYAEADLNHDDEENRKRKENLLSKKKSNEEESGNPSMAVSFERKNKLHREQKLSNLSFIRLMRQTGNYQCCPKCRMAVERTAGCDMMHCSQCTASFCWRCGMCNNIVFTSYKIM